MTGTSSKAPPPYSKAFRLLKHADYDRVYKQGRRHFSPLMTFFYMPRTSVTEAEASPRVGITVGRALGGAVARNRIKRRMREAVRAHIAVLTADPAVHADIVINPKKIALGAEFAKLTAEVARGFEQVRKQLALSSGAAR